HHLHRSRLERLGVHDAAPVASCIDEYATNLSEVFGRDGRRLCPRRKLRGCSSTKVDGGTAGKKSVDRREDGRAREAPGDDLSLFEMWVPRIVRIGDLK